MAILLSIVALWGTGISMLIVLLNMRLGFASTEKEFNQYFLELTQAEMFDDLELYIRAALNKQNAAEYYSKIFNPDITNFRFSVTDTNNTVLLTNGDNDGANTEKLAEIENWESIPAQEQSYAVNQHFNDFSSLYDAVVGGLMPQFLNDGDTFELWYFTDADIDDAYHHGISVSEDAGGQVIVLPFQTLESAKDFNYAERYGSDFAVQFVGAEGEPEYNPALWQRVKDEVGEKAIGTAKYWAIIENISGEAKIIRFTDYLRRVRDGEVLLVTDPVLREKLSNGVDVTIMATPQSIGSRVCIHTYLLAGMPVADRIRSNYGVFHLVYQYSEGIVLTMFGFLILAIISCIAMCSMAGHAHGKGGVIVSAVHKMPYEFFWLLPPATILISLFVLSDITSQATIPYRIHAIFAAGMILMIAASIVLYLYTTAVRFKSETFWQSFGTVRFLSFITSIFKNRTLTCIALIAYIAGLVGLNMFASRRGGWWMGSVLLLDGVSAAGLLYCVYAYFELYRHVKQMESGDFSPMERALPLIADFSSFDTALGDITNQVGEMVARQTKAEHLRTELITNVSHDLKTPLTSIVNYVDLLSREPMQSTAATEYLDVLKRQAARLKKLTIDLVEASKASTGNLTVELQPMNLQVLVGQIAGEYEEQLEQKNLSLVMNVPDEPVSVLADGRQIWRVFDNLLGNACKYAMNGSRVYLDVRAGEANVTITLKNVSAMPLNTSAEELMERFVRGDASRHTEGSGLGLSIARDLTRLQQGTLTLQTDGDLFKAVLVFPIYRAPEENKQPEYSGIGFTPLDLPRKQPAEEPPKTDA